MDLNRILSGQTEHKRELVAAGIFALIWFAMDAAQWIDWLTSSMRRGNDSDSYQVPRKNLRDMRAESEVVVRFDR